MNEALQNLEIKVENGGSTPQGRVSAAEWNVLVAGVKALDLAGFDEAALRDYLDQYDYITRPELNKALEGIGGGSGGGIAYPLTWSGYSQGVWDGSTAANIVIPCLLSQLTNDVEFITSADLPSFSLRASSSSIGKLYLCKNGVDESDATLLLPTKLSQFANDSDFITTASVNSLLTDYVDKTSIKNYMGWSQKHHVSQNIDSLFDFGVVSTAGNVNSPSTAAYGVVATFPYRNAYGNSIPDLAAQLYFPNGDEATPHLFWRSSIKNSWNNWRTILDSSNYPNYALPITGGTIKGGVDFDKTSGPILTIRDGRYVQSTAMSVGWTYREGDMIKLHVPGNSNHDFYLMLSQYAGATLTMGLTVNGNLLATGEITQHSSLELKDVVDTRFLTLKELVALKPYSFRWKDGRDDKLHAGAVADYVKPILPEVISTDKDDIHSMNYANAAWVVSTSLTPYVNNLVEEMKRLKSRIKYLEDKLKEC